MLEPYRAGRDVAHLAVDDDRAEAAAADRLPTQHDWRAREVIASEHGRRGRIDLPREECEVFCLRLQPAVPARASESLRETNASVQLHHAAAQKPRRLLSAALASVSRHSMKSSGPSTPHRLPNQPLTASVTIVTM